MHVACLAIMRRWWITLRRALADELPVNARDGGFIAPGYLPELDELRQLRDESRRLIAGLQTRYVSETGVQGLKIRHNNVLGYFVEVSAKQADNMPGGAEGPFIHRQTMANAVRYTSVELNDLEGRIGRAADRALSLELTLFDTLVERDRWSWPIRSAARPVRWRPSTWSPPWRSWRWMPDTAARQWTIAVSGSISRVAAIRWWKRCWRPDSKAAFVANECNLADGSKPVAADRPQHGGQKYLP